MSNRFHDRVVAPGSADPPEAPAAPVFLPISGTSTRTSVLGAIVATTLLAANPARLGATVFNDSTANLFLALGSGASTTSFTIKLATGTYYQIPFNFVGIITGIWDAVNGNARVTELTA